MKVKFFLNTGECEGNQPSPVIIRKDSNSVGLNGKSARNIYIYGFYHMQSGDFSNLIWVYIYKTRHCGLKYFLELIISIFL